MSSFFRELFKLARLEELSEKNASVGVSVAQAKQRLWTRMKTAAASETEGEAVGLARLATAVYTNASLTDHEKTANAADDAGRDILAVSFASALAVDRAIEKMASAGSISSDDASSLYALNAASAIEDLKALAKLAAPNWLTHPSTIGAIGGGAIGAGLGAWGDDENRVRGGIMGGLGGAAIGSLGGLAVQHWRDAASAEQQAELAKQTADMAALAQKQQHAQAMWERLHNTAQQMGTGTLPGEAGSVADRLAKHRDAIVAHFASGESQLPGAVLADLNPHEAESVVRQARNLFPSVGSK